MIHAGIDVGEEAVLPWARHLPRVPGLGGGEIDLHNRLHAFEAVFPRHHQPQRRAILIGQHPAVEANGHKRERMHRLVEPQALNIRPLQYGVPLARHLLWIKQGRELDVLGAASRLQALDQVTERESQPRNDHRPGLDAPHAVDALLEREPPQQVLDGQRARLAHLARDLDRPRTGA